MSTHGVRRSELYSQVWQVSMVQLAKTYGISDVALAKVCVKHSIPRPPRGYWAKVQAGQSPQQAPLPNPGNDYVIQMRDPSQVPAAGSAIGDELKQELLQARCKASEIAVASSLRGAHPLITHANQVSQGPTETKLGLLVLPANTGLAISVSRKALRRALLILDALLKAFEARGYQVAQGPTVSLLGVSVSIAISEILEAKREAPSEHPLEGRYHFGHSRFLETRVPSGRLELRLNHPESYWLNGCRRTWHDAKSPLEDRLPSVVEGVVKIAAHVKERLAKVERQQRKEEEARQTSEEEARRRAEMRARIKAERDRVRQLYHEARNWVRSQNLRDFIEAKRRLHTAAGEEIGRGSAFSDWAEWAGQQADRLDPLRASPPSILDEEPPEPEQPIMDRRRLW